MLMFMHIFLKYSYIWVYLKMFFLPLHFIPENSSYSFHWIALKLGGLLDLQVVHMFWGYYTPNFII